MQCSLAMQLNLVSASNLSSIEDIVGSSFRNSSSKNLILKAGLRFRSRRRIDTCFFCVDDISFDM